MSRTKTKRAIKVAQASLLRERIEAERRKLQRAAAVLVALVYAQERGLESEQCADVASTALDLVEHALAGLDSVALARSELA